MKKTILALGLMVALASCGGTATETTAPKADSVAVVDTIAPCVDTAQACVDTVKAVK